ncbi:oligosaccharide flippase family protein [Claveliimonas bilis]|uniref:oligosaccharide flippase family protein n=1 Tax=Claveliimonas bilis TaxID=3028070 RepID=UPI0029318A43|nr:oligosaccharide flippase family protein [Claveliimonas bilis]
MATQDTNLLCALLKYIRRLYYVIGGIIVVVGIALIPFLPYLISGEVSSDLNITVMYGIYLLNTAIGYFFYSYKSTLLNAGQNVGTISNINSGIIFFQSLVQILVVVAFKSYYGYLILMPIFTLINNLWISYAVKKFYPHIICKNELPPETKKDISTHIKGLFVTRICNTTRNALDSIFISAFLGLTTAAIYGNYYYIMFAVTGILNAITTAMTASVGNSLVTENVEKNYRDMRKFNFLFNWIVGFCTCCLLTMYQPFMQVWVGEEGVFPINMVFIFCLYFYFLNIGSIRAVYHDAAGLWWEARYRAILEAVVNLILNFVLTSTLGAFGTVLGTLISLVFINYMYGAQIVFKYYFKGVSVMEYFKDNGKYGLVTLIACVIAFLVSCRLFNHGWIGIITGFISSLLIFNAIYLLFFRRTKLFKESWRTIKGIIGLSKKYR